MNELLFFLGFSVLIIVGIAIFKYRTKLTGAGNLGAVMPQGMNTRLFFGGLITAIIGGLIWWYWAEIMALNFFWKLMLFVPFAFLGWRLSKGHKFTLGSTLFWFGVIGMIAVILASNFGKAVEQTVVQAEESMDSGSLSFGISCPGTQEVAVGETFILKKGCITRLRVSADNTNPHYQMTMPVFSEPFNHYASPSWAGHNLIELEPIEATWPENVSETRATLLTAEQAAQIVQSRIVIDVSE